MKLSRQSFSVAQLQPVLFSLGMKVIIAYIFTKAAPKIAPAKNLFFICIPAAAAIIRPIAAIECHFM
jgi:hypothetical protein